jgi:hypothetical protein
MDAKSLQKENERLKKENEALKATVEKEITFKVSEKGGCSVYNLGQRFPVTLYREQWLRLLDKKEELLEFLEENKDKLATKT